MVQLDYFRYMLLAAVAGKIAASDSCEVIEETMDTLLKSSCGQDYLAKLCGGEVSTSPKPVSTSTTAASTSTTAPTTPAGPTSPRTTAAPGSEPFIGTYYPNWMVYSKFYMGVDQVGTTNGSAGTPDASYTFWPSDAPALLSKVNTLYYAFLSLNPSCYVTDADPDASWYGTDSLPSWIDMSPHPKACKGAVNDMLGMKAQYPHLKLMLSLGGWTFSQNYSNCAKDEANFKKMYDSFSFYTGGDFGKSDSMWAGIDFDWEHPAAAGFTEDFDASVDWPNYGKMVQYFRDRATEEGRSEMLMTAAVGIGETLDILLKDSASANTFCSNIDHINLMTYDMHGKWEAVTGHNAPFCQIDDIPEARPAPRPLSWAVMDRVSALADLCGPSKVALGIPNYSPGWTEIPSTNDGLYQKSSNSDPIGWATWSTFSDSDKNLVPQGIVHWWDLKKAVADSSSGLKVFSKDCPAAEGIVVPVKWVYSSSKKIFASYEDEETVQRKVEWAKAKGLAGFFYWDMSQDKDGDLLDAGRDAWGVTDVHKASGSAKCFDDRKPDFSANPDGSENPYAGCHTSKRSVVVPAGSGCTAMKDQAQAACGAKDAIPVGGHHTGSTDCINPCTQTWGNGALWADDTVYYVCDGEEVDGGGDGGDGGNGGNDTPSGKDCYARAGWQNSDDCIVCSDVSGASCAATSWTACYSTKDKCLAGAAGGPGDY